MEPLFFELTDLLTRQNEIIKHQLGASREQNEALRNVDREKLDTAVRRLDELTGQMTGLDREREHIQRRLEEGLGMEPGATLQELLPKAPFELLLKLKGLASEMRDNLRQLDELNKLNNLLTRRVLQVNEAMLEIFKSGGDKKTYQQSGKVKPSERSAAVLDKSV